MTGEVQEGLFDSRSDLGEASCAVVSKRNRKSSAQARSRQPLNLIGVVYDWPRAGQPCPGRVSLEVLKRGVCAASHDLTRVRCSSVIRICTDIKINVVVKPERLSIARKNIR